MQATADRPGLRHVAVASGVGWRYGEAHTLGVLDELKDRADAAWRA